MLKKQKNGKREITIKKQRLNTAKKASKHSKSTSAFVELDSNLYMNGLEVLKQ